MPDTTRFDYPDKYCAWCGRLGECYLKHWGPLFRGKLVYLDSCAAGDLRAIGPGGVEQRFDCDTGEPVAHEASAGG